MRREFRLPRVILRQRVRQGSDPIADLQRKMRCRRANHLHKLSLIRDGIDVFANSHGHNLATTGHSGDRG
jgi:hypothetical protein